MNPAGNTTVQLLCFLSAWAIIVSSVYLSTRLEQRNAPHRLVWLVGCLTGIIVAILVMAA